MSNETYELWNEMVETWKIDEGLLSDGTPYPFPTKISDETVFKIAGKPLEEQERIIKEEQIKENLKNKEEFLKQLPERRLKRIAVIEKHKAILDASIVGKQKGIRFRKYFHSYVNAVAQRVFKTEDQEYTCVGKVGRLPYTDYENLGKAYNKKDPMTEKGVIADIITEFGCFDY